MAMVLAGARGDNAAEMAKVLGQKLPGDEINAANAAVLASLNGAPPASFQLRVANARAMPFRKATSPCCGRSMRPRSFRAPTSQR
jgi:hypothetical protein